MENSIIDFILFFQMKVLNITTKDICFLIPEKIKSTQQEQIEKSLIIKDLKFFYRFVLIYVFLFSQEIRMIMMPFYMLRIGQNPELIALLRVERDHSPPAHAQQVLHRHLAAAEHNRELDIDAVDLGFIEHAGFPSDSALVQPERVSWA